MNKAKKLVEILVGYFGEIRKKLSEFKRKDIVNFIKPKSIAIAALIIFIISTIILFASTITSKKELINDLEVALKEDKSRKIDNYIEFKENSIASKDLEPLMEYYNNDNKRINATIDELKKSGKSDIFTINVKKKLFFDDYYLEMNAISIKVNSNIKPSKIFLDEKIIDGNVAADIVPGVHTVRCELETPYGIVQDEKEVLAINDEEVTLNLDAMNIEVTSNFDDADVFINGKNTGKKAKDIKDLGPIPMNSEIKMYLQKEFPWGVIKSDEVTIGDVPNINANINIANEGLIENIKSISQKFYTSVFEALNNKNSDLILYANDDTKEKIYNEIEKKAIFLTNNYEISDLITEIESSEFTYTEGAYKANVVIKVNYSIYKKLLPFVKEDHEGMFLTNMKYVGNQWIVEDIQKFNL